jgi:hypothetical protein
MLSALTVMTLLMVTTIAVVMARAEAPPTPAPIRKQGPTKPGSRIRMTR